MRYATAAVIGRKPITGGRGALFSLGCCKYVMNEYGPDFLGSMQVGRCGGDV